MKDILALFLILVVVPASCYIGYSLITNNICSKRAKMEGYLIYEVVGGRCYGSYNNQNWEHIFK